MSTSGLEYDIAISGCPSTSQICHESREHVL